MVNRYGVICKDFNYQELTRYETLLYLNALLAEIIPAKERLDANPDAVHDMLHMKYVYDNYAALIELIQIVGKADAESYFYVDKDRIHLYNSDVSVFIYGQVGIIRYSCVEGELRSHVCSNEEQYIDLLLWTRYEKPLIVRDNVSYAKASAMAKMKESSGEEHNYKVIYTVDTVDASYKRVAIIRATDENKAKEYLFDWWKKSMHKGECLGTHTTVKLITDEHILYTGR